VEKFKNRQEKFKFEDIFLHWNCVAYNKTWWTGNVEGNRMFCTQSKKGTPVGNFRKLLIYLWN